MDNLGLSITELRAIQDEAYARSLVVDQKKVYNASLPCNNGNR